MHWMGGNAEAGAGLRWGVPMGERSFSLREFIVKCGQIAGRGAARILGASLAELPLD
jgi:hypothetical protein